LTFKQVLVRWFKLTFLLGIFVAFHVAVHFEARPLARLVATPYVPLTESEALARYPYDVATVAYYAETFGKINCLKAKLNSREATSDCIERVVDEANSIRSNPTLPLSQVHVNHKAEHEKEHVDPQVKNLQQYVFPLVFGLLYAGIGVLALVALSQWFRVAFQGKFQSRLANFYLALNVFKRNQERRTLRAAASELNDLISLHQNGLISDEAFLKRKAELSAALESEARLT
jgi:hypothetical protein